MLKLILITSTLYANSILENPSFEEGKSPWTTESHSGAKVSGTLLSDNPPQGAQYFQAEVTSLGTENWHAQFKAPSFQAVNGKNYELTFWVKGPSTIHIAQQTGSPDYAYLSGTDFSIQKEWTQITYKFQAKVNGTLHLNLYLGNALGQYSFDEFKLSEVGELMKDEIKIPEVSAWESGVHRNLFAEMGITQSDISAKLNHSFEQLFMGDSLQERIYFEVDSTQAFIKAIDSDDIRSEGMSYGMMIAVMLNKKEIFDKLWRFAHTYSLHKTGERKGYFSWQLETTPPYKMIDSNPAPDGEEYFAMALFFAEKRWGDGENILKYSTQAKQILKDMVQKTAGSEINPMMHPVEKQILFSPAIQVEPFTDPSYHLPSFYELYSLWDIENSSYWKEAAVTSRAFFKKTCHPTTGLAPDYANFDGTPKSTSFNSNSHLAAHDAFRVIGNLAMDYSWFQADEWQVEQADRLLGFYKEQGSYKSVYTLDGVPQVDYQSAGLVAMNAIGALASSKLYAWDFVEALWNQAPPTGKYRYYDGLLHLLALLHVSGEFKIWGNDNLIVSKTILPKESAEIKQALNFFNPTDSDLNLSIFSLDGKQINTWLVPSKSKGQVPPSLSGKGKLAFTIQGNTQSGLLLF